MMAIILGDHDGGPRGNFIREGSPAFAVGLDRYGTSAAVIEDL
jgi:hypothetical protein